MNVHECRAMIEQKVWVRRTNNAGGGVDEVTIDGVLCHHDGRHRELISIVIRDSTGHVSYVLPKMLYKDRPETVGEKEENDTADT